MKKLRIAMGMTIIQLIFLVHAAALYAQGDQTVYYGKKYLDINIKAVDKYNERVKREQTRALSKLKRKERRFANKLQRKDSAAYARYQPQSLSFDSISKLNRQDISGTRKTSSRNVAIDSLQRVKRFLEKYSNAAGGMENNLANYGQKLNTQQSQLNHNKYVEDLISKRTKDLQALSGSSKLKGAGVQSIAKCTYYTKERTKILQQISDEPSNLEERSLEFLQGQEGFDSYLKGEPNGMEGLAGKGMDATALEKMGYQTKRQVNAQIQSKLGGNSAAVQQKMAGSVQKYQQKAQKIVSARDQVKQNAKEVKDARQSIRQVGNIEKPTFKVNPMRAQPFWLRVEKQYNWQTTRATLDGNPAMVQASIMFGFRHTPQLTYGVGIAPTIGLGKNWNIIKLSFEGIGLRTYVERKMILGIGLYGGYERTYKLGAFDKNRIESNLTPNKHNTSTYHESVMLGLTKSYSINDKWNGSLQVLYDVWWKDKGLRSPVVIRFATINK